MGLVLPLTQTLVHVDKITNRWLVRCPSLFPIPYSHLQFNTSTITNHVTPSNSPPRPPFQVTQLLLLPLVIIVSHIHSFPTLLRLLLPSTNLGTTPPRPILIITTLHLPFPTNPRLFPSLPSPQVSPHQQQHHHQQPPPLLPPPPPLHTLHNTTPLSSLLPFSILLSYRLQHTPPAGVTLPWGGVQVKEGRLLWVFP